MIRVLALLGSLALLAACGADGMPSAPETKGETAQNVRATSRIA